MKYPRIPLFPTNFTKPVSTTHFATTSVKAISPFLFLASSATLVLITQPLAKSSPALLDMKQLSLVISYLLSYSVCDFVIESQTILKFWVDSLHYFFLFLTIFISTFLVTRALTCYNTLHILFFRLSTCMFCFIANFETALSTQPSNNTILHPFIFHNGILNGTRFISMLILLQMVLK
jgi:hypothetical protein